MRIEIKKRDIVVLVLLSLFISGCKSNKSLVSSSPVSAEIKTTRDNEAIKYYIGMGDVLSLSVLYHPEYTLSLDIGPDEIISVPRVHNFNVSGKTSIEIENELKQKLSKYLVSPDVSLNIKKYSLDKVVVLGKVKNPGVFPYSRNLNFYSAIAQAGGLEDSGEKSTIVIIPKDQKNKPFTVSFKVSDDKIEPVKIHPGDIIFVPAKPIHKVNIFVRQFFQNTNPVLKYFLDALDITHYNEVFRTRVG